MSETSHTQSVTARTGRLPLTKLETGISIVSSLGLDAVGVSALVGGSTTERLMGAGLLIKGLKDQHEILRPVPTEGTPRDRARNRVHAFAESLRTGNEDRSPLSTRIRETVGENLQALNGTTAESLGYRNRFNRLMGSYAILGAGLAAMTTGTTTAERIGGALASGLAMGEVSYDTMNTEPHQAAMERVATGESTIHSLPKSPQ